MTVIELIQKLSEYPPDLEIVVASDPEGKSYHMLDERMITGFAQGEWDLEVGYEDDWDEEDSYPGDNCLIIGP